MKRFLSLSISVALSASMFAGGIMTNTNQSAMFTRLQARDATVGIDAVYYNPAGLTLLPNNGFYLSLNNQTVGQTKLVTSYNPLLNTVPTEYKGTVSAPFFPGLYAAYKMDKWAFSFGVNPIGGGGGAQFEDGLPSFESLIAPLVPMLQSQLAPVDQQVITNTGNDPMFRNVSGYSYDVFFEGSSIYIGYQANASYAINEMLSVGIGGRYVTAQNTYNGYMRDIEIIAPEAYGGQQAAGAYIRTIGTITGQSAAMEPTAMFLDAMTQDIEVDVVESGTGFTPIISLNAKVSDQVNLSFKYEHKTEIELETEVLDGKDGGGMYVDGEKNRADMPAQIVLGATYNPKEKLMLTTGFHMYLDSQANYGKTATDPESGEEVKLENSEILDNSLEFALGAEYSVSEKVDLSLGWLLTQTGAKDAFQSDLSYSMNSNTLGGGFAYNFSEKLQLNLGGSYTMYSEGEKTLDGMNPDGTPTTYKETYFKDVWIVAIGLNINFGAIK